jgi:hypothetical protein
MRPRGDGSLWLAVGVAFAVLIGAWLLLFKIAADHPVQTVPLATPAASAPETR